MAKLSLIFIYILVILYSRYFGLGKCDYEYHPSVGIAFQVHHAKLNPIQDTALLQFSLPLQSPPKLVPLERLEPQDRRNLIQIESINDLISDYNVLRTLMQGLYNEVIEQVRGDSFIVKRGALNFVGTGLSWLFGVATEDDLAQFKMKVSKVEEGIRFVHDEVDNMKQKLSVALERTGEQFKSVWTAVEEQAENSVRLGQITRDISIQMAKWQNSTSMKLRWIDKTIVFTQQLTAYGMHVQNEITRMESYIETYNRWLEGLETLQQGYLDPTLVHPTAVKEALNSVYKSLNDNDSPLKIAFHSVHDVYRLPSAVYAYANESLYIRMAIPLAVTDKPFQLFKVEILPMPLHNHEQEAHQILKSKVDYLLVDQSRGFFYELTEKQYLDCATAPGMVCPKLITIKADATDSCIVAVYLKVDSLIANICKFTVVHTPLPTFIRAVGEGNYLLSMQSKPQLVCRNGTEILNDISYSTLTLPCYCKIKTQTEVTAYHYCRLAITKYTELHPVNFPLAHAFNKSHYFTKDKTIFQSFEQPVFEMPDFSEILDKVPSTIINGKKESDLSDLIKALNEPSVLPSMQDDAFDAWFSWSGDLILIQVLQALVGVANSVAICYILYRLRMISVFLMAAIPHTKAVEIRVSTLAPLIPPSPPVTENHLSMVDYGLRIGVGILLAVVLFLRVMQSWQIARFCCRNWYRALPVCFHPQQRNQYVYLYAKIHNARHSVVVYLTKVPFEFGHSYFSDLPTIKMPSASCYFCYPHVNFSYEHKLEIIRGNDIKKVDLPRMKGVSPFLQRKLKKIVSHVDPIHISWVYRLNSQQAYAPVEGQLNVAPERTPGATTPSGRSIEDPDVTEHGLNIIGPARQILKLAKETDTINAPIHPPAYQSNVPGHGLASAPRETSVDRGTTMHQGYHIATVEPALIHHPLLPQD
jgi:hypothetical protein